MRRRIPPGRNAILMIDLIVPSAAHAAGFRRLGIGALIGLTRWQDEAVALAAHLEHLFKRCWQAQITVSVPVCVRRQANFARYSR